MSYGVLCYLGQAKYINYLVYELIYSFFHSISDIASQNKIHWTSAPMKVHFIVINNLIVTVYVAKINVLTVLLSYNI